jgi:alkylhydroperoxidase/carboxymuconolactone decarboxylase family protein YurZ
MVAATPEDIQAARALHDRMLGPYPEPIGDEFDRFFDITCRVLWPELWLDNTLDPRTRSLCTVAALTALDRTNVRKHIKAALANGASKAEIAEVITQMAFYAGWPCAGNAARTAREVFREVDAV